MESKDPKTESDSSIPVDAVPSTLERIVGTRSFDDVLYSETYVDRTTPDSLFPGERADEIE